MWSHLKRTVFGITPQCWLWRIWVCWCWGRERPSTPLTWMISPFSSLRCRFDFLSFISWQQHNRILSPCFRTAHLYSLYWFLSTPQVLWKVTEEKQKECTSKGKHPDVSKDLCHTCLKTHKHISGNTLNKGGCFSIWYQKSDWSPFQIDCRNYVRMLHQMNDGVMYVCGTNAFSPTCDYIVSDMKNNICSCFLNFFFLNFYISIINNLK